MRLFGKRKGRLLEREVGFQKEKEDEKEGCLKTRGSLEKEAFRTEGGFLEEKRLLESSYEVLELCDTHESYKF